MAVALHCDHLLESMAVWMQVCYPLNLLFQPLIKIQILFELNSSFVAHSFSCSLEISFKDQKNLSLVIINLLLLFSPPLCLIVC